MAFISSTNGSWAGSTVSVSVPVAAGDILVALLYARSFSVASGAADASRLDVPDGWQRVGLWAGEASGSPQRADSAVIVVWHRAASAGTVNATFTWPGAVAAPVEGGVDVLRYSGMKAVRGFAAQRLSSTPAVFPAVPVEGVPSAVGHSLRLLVPPPNRTNSTGAWVPSGHTLRVSRQMHNAGFRDGWVISRLVASDESLSGVGPDVASAATTARLSGWGVTLYLASTYGPSAPVLVDAPGPIEDLAAPWTLAWTPDGAQTGVRVTRQRIDASGAPTGTLEYLTSMSTPAWTGTETTITSTATSVAFPAGMFDAAGARYRVTVATVGDAAAPDLGDAASVDVESWQAPVVTSVSSGNIVGGEFSSRLPWITVAGTPGSGAALDLCGVEVVDADTGQVYAAGTHGPTWWYPVPVTLALPNGASVRLRGRVRQRGTQWSNWIEAGPYLVTVPRPATPTITLADVTHPASRLPGIAATVTSVPGVVTIYRDGERLGEWDSTGHIVIDDYTSPTDAPVTYTATVAVGDPLPEESLPATATGMLSTAADGHCWLMDPLDPATAVQAHCVGIEEHIGRPSQVYWPLRHDAPVTPIVHSLPHHKRTGTLTFDVDTPDQEARVLALLTSGRPLIYRRWVETDPTNPGQQYPLAPLRFTPHGDLPIARPAVGPWTSRHITTSWAEQ